MILSNKNILPVLWEMFPDHPNLLPSYFEKDLVSAIMLMIHLLTFLQDKLCGNYVKKPVLGREGSNVSIITTEGTKYTTGGEYGDEAFIYQQVPHQHKPLALANARLDLHVTRF